MKPLTDAGYGRAIQREAAALARLERYEKKSVYWLGKVLATRAELRRIRKRVEESELARMAAGAEDRQ